MTSTAALPAAIIAKLKQSTDAVTVPQLLRYIHQSPEVYSYLAGDETGTSTASASVRELLVLVQAMSTYCLNSTSITGADDDPTPNHLTARELMMVMKAIHRQYQQLGDDGPGMLGMAFLLRLCTDYALSLRLTMEDDGENQLFDVMVEFISCVSSAAHTCVQLIEEKGSGISIDLSRLVLIESSRCVATLLCRLASSSIKQRIAENHLFDSLLFQLAFMLRPPTASTTSVKRRQDAVDLLVRFAAAERLGQLFSPTWSDCIILITDPRKHVDDGEEYGDEDDDGEDNAMKQPIVAARNWSELSTENRNLTLKLCILLQMEAVGGNTAASIGSTDDDLAESCKDRWLEISLSIMQADFPFDYLLRQPTVLCRQLSLAFSLLTPPSVRTGTVGIQVRFLAIGLLIRFIFESLSGQQLVDAARSWDILAAQSSRLNNHSVIISRLSTYLLNSCTHSVQACKRLKQLVHHALLQRQMPLID